MNFSYLVFISTERLNVVYLILLYVQPPSNHTKLLFPSR